MDTKRCTPCDWDDFEDADLASLALIAAATTADRDSFAQRVAIYFYGCTTTLYSSDPDKIRDMEMSFLDTKGGTRNE